MLQQPSQVLCCVEHRFVSSDRCVGLVAPPWAITGKSLDRSASCRAVVVSKRAMTEARGLSAFGWKPPQGRRLARRLTISLGSSRSFGDREPPIGAATQGATSWTEANPRRKARCCGYTHRFTG
jgi:hypothetical protein